MILLTGATGHLGANLVRLIVSHRQEVRVLVRPTSNLAALEGLPIEKVVGDLRDPASLKSAVDGCDRVFHCAALISTTEGRHRELFETNVLGTRNLLDAALAVGARRVVVSGSFSAVGNVEGRPSNEEDPFDPFSGELPYAHSKACMEHECLKAIAKGLDVVIAISCAIIGPHDYRPSRVGQAFIDYAHGRLRFYIPGGFEFVAASDIAQGHLLAMERGRCGERYIFSTQFLTIDEVFDIWARITGNPARPRRLPAAFVYGCGKLLKWLPPRWFPGVRVRFTPGAVRLLQLQRRADIGKARRELGFTPSSIEGAIEEAYDDFVRRGLIRPRNDQPNDSELTAR
jgi:nucleoside-diphosphate-sugar epimerase